MDWQAVSRTIWRSYIVRALVRRTFGRSGEWDDRAIGMRSVDRMMASILRHAVSRSDAGVDRALLYHAVSRSDDGVDRLRHAASRSDAGVDRALLYRSFARLLPVRPLISFVRSFVARSADRATGTIERLAGGRSIGR